MVLLLLFDHRTLSYQWWRATTTNKKNINHNQQQQQVQEQGSIISKQRKQHHHQQQQEQRKQQQQQQQQQRVSSSVLFLLLSSITIVHYYFLCIGYFSIGSLLFNGGRNHIINTTTTTLTTTTKMLSSYNILILPKRIITAATPTTRRSLIAASYFFGDTSTIGTWFTSSSGSRSGNNYYGFVNSFSLIVPSTTRHQYYSSYRVQAAAVAATTTILSSSSSLTGGRSNHNSNNNNNKHHHPYRNSKYHPNRSLLFGIRQRSIDGSDRKDDGVVVGGGGISTTTTTTTLDTDDKSTITTTSSSSKPIPPVAYRDENRVVYAGIAPNDWPDDVIRQAENSIEPLLDPPIAIPDPYGWLRDENRTNEQVLQHLHNENQYTNAVTHHLNESGFMEQLYNELVSTIQETDYTTPRPDGPYWYYTRTYEGKSYPVYCRAPKTTDDELPPTLPIVCNSNEPILPGEQVILDENILAMNHTYCSVGSMVISPSTEYVAYTIDYTGDEIYTVVVQNIETGQQLYLGEQVIETAGTVLWSTIDDNTIYYTKMDIAHRPYQVYQRSLTKLMQPTCSLAEQKNGGNDNDNVDDDVSEILLYEDNDEMNWINIYKSSDDQYLFIESSSKETTEIQYMNLIKNSNTDSSTSQPLLQCIAQRRPKVLYEVDHRNGYWWISSNVNNLPNFALFTSPAIPNSATNWTLVTCTGDNSTATIQPCFDGSYNRSLESVHCFKDHVVASGREDGLPQLWILRDITVSGGTSGGDGTTTKVTMERLEFPETAYDVGFGTNHEYNTSTVAISYSSLITPSQTIAIHMDNTTDRTILKQRIVPGYDPTLYSCERITNVPSRDGTTKIPISIVYRKDIMERHLQSGEPLPVHLYGYGSYGASMEADFVASRLPLLNRGMVHIIAHIRGGSELGRPWYEEPNGAKYLCKQNTFYDFVDVATWLIQTKQLTTSDLLSIEGRSAGGLLIGASINIAPHLFRVAILGVPFVDVVPTMIDARIPLTVVEWEEWGNPNEIKYFHYMMEYSPIHNVRPNKQYPACLLTGGLYDPRVQYWEPAKFAAELRHTAKKDESRPICLKIDMSAGHFSASDRYKYLREKAFDYAFVLDQIGLTSNHR